MADRATTNPSDMGGSVSAMDPSTDIDNPENLNFWEPGEVENDDADANPEQAAEGIAGETDEAAEAADQETEATAEGEQTEEQEADEPEGDKPAGKDATDDDILVKLKGGEQVPLKELKLGCGGR